MRFPVAAWQLDHALRNSTRHSLDQREVRVGMFQFRAVVRRAGRNEYIRGRNGDSRGSTPASQFECILPDRLVHGELGDHSFEIPQNAFLKVPAGAVP